MRQGCKNKFNTLKLKRAPDTDTTIGQTQQEENPANQEMKNIDESNEDSDESSLPELNLTDDLDEEPAINIEQLNTSLLSCNKVLLSSSTTDDAKTIIKSRPSELLSSHLYLSDSDDTISSQITNDDNDQDDCQKTNSLTPAATDIAETQIQMQMLQIAPSTEQPEPGVESEEIFSHRSSSEFSLPVATQRYHTNVKVLSKQLDNLSLIHEEPIEGKGLLLTGTTVPYRSSDFDFSQGIQTVVAIVHPQPQINRSNILTGTTVPNTSSFTDEKLNDKNATVKDNGGSLNDSILSISSSSSSNNFKNENESNYSDDEGEESDSDDVAVITISDSDEENDEFHTIVPEKQPEVRPSVASSSFSSTVVQKLDAFFNNIPLIESQSPNTSLHLNIEKITEKESSNRENDESINVDESIIVDETPEQSVHSETKSSDDKCDESIYVSQTPEPIAENSLVTHETNKNSTIDHDSDAQNLNENKTPSPKQTANFHNIRPSNEIFKSTPKSQTSSIKGTQTINISAKINIQIQLPANESSASDSGSSKTSGDTTNSSEENVPVIDKPETPKKQHLSVDKTLDASSPTKERKTTKKVLPNPRRSEIDFESQDILNKLYGNKWQTPELLQKCASRSRGDVSRNISRPLPFTEVKRPKPQKPQTRDSFANDFCILRRNAPDLESTRIGTYETQKPTETETIIEEESIVESTEEFKKPNDNNLLTSKLSSKSNVSDNSSLTLRSRKKKPLAQKINYSDDSDSDFNNDTDDSWSNDVNKIDNTSSSSSNEEEHSNRPQMPRSTTRKKKSTTGKKEKSFADKLVYLDLTNLEIDEDKNHISPNATEEELTEITQKFLFDNILDSCEFKKKIYQPDYKKKENDIITEKTPITKRKLFTPSQYNYRDDDDNDGSENTSTSKTPLIESNEKPSSPPLFQSNVDPKLLIPINRHLEIVKKFEFQQPRVPSLPKTPTIKSQPTTAVVVQSPKTPVSASKKLAIIARDSFFSSQKTFGFLHSLDVRISKENCHPDAIRYRTNFKSNRDELSDYLYKLYNENVFDNKLNVPVLWNKKLTKTAGRCKSRSRQGVLSCTIELSDKVVTSCDRLRCTLIHEMCHAATWIFDKETGHGEKWRNWAKRANNVFQELPPIKVCHQYDIKYKYVYICTLCGAKSNSHSKSKKVELIRCAYCHGSIEIFLNKTDKDGTPMKVPVRQANGFAKFVKEKYKDFRRPGVTHGDAMKLLSNAFAELKCDVMSA